MACCCRKKTEGKEPQSIRRESEQSSSISGEIEYLITIKTGDHQNSGTDGPVYINIFDRDEMQTDELLLKGPFQQDSIKKIQVKAKDIGKPQRIIIRHEDQTKGWFIDYVEISIHSFLIRFLANRWLNKSKYDRKLSAELFGSEQPAADYHLEIRTGIEQIDPLDSPVYMQIYGTTTKTPKLFLESKNTPFAKDSIAKFQISSNNVGEIRKIVIGHENLGTVNDWHLQNVKIQTADQQHEFTVNKWLSATKEDQRTFIELNCELPRTTSPTLVKYLVTGKTVDVQRTDAIDKIEMIIHGSNGYTDKIFLKNVVKSNPQRLFQKGSLDRFEIEQKEIGNIESVTIGFDDPDQKAALLLESIDIEYKGAVYHFRADCWLSSRLGSNFSWLTLKPDTNTDVIIETGESNIDANVMLCIYGENTTTQMFPLRTKNDGTLAKFTKHSRLTFDLKGIEVGHIKKINIGHDGKGSKQPWLFKSIVIEKDDERYTFKTNQYLSKESKNFIDLFPEGSKSSSPRKDQTTYTITIVTSSKKDSSTDSGIFMTIYGDKDRTKQFPLVTSKQDSNLFEIELNDVGKIEKINIGQDGKGLHPIWHLESVQVQKGIEIYNFHADQILDFSMPDIDLIPTSPNIEKTSSRRSSTVSEKTSDTIYKISTRLRSLQQTTIHDGANLYLVIFGDDRQTKRLSIPNNKQDEIEFITTDVGKISKILLGQGTNPHGIVWHVDSVIIKRDNDTTIFNVKRSIKSNTEYEISLSKTPTLIVKRKDIRYEIKTTTGEKSFDGAIVIKIRGEFGIINIPLSKSESGEKPFQAKAIDVFTSQTTDVGKIKRITLEHNETKTTEIWHLKKLQIIKGNETYNFNANIQLDYREQKVNLYPIDQKKDDYVQSELRRLKQNLRSESAKMRRPPHKAHEPFIYNDLSPYFDTTTVEKAIHEPIETPPGYYTRLTALRIVEPWEAYGMDYGVSYELLKQRKSRGQSAKRSMPTQHGIIFLPPFSLPSGGQISYVNSARFDRSPSISTKRRSFSKRHHEQLQITTATT